MTPNRRNALKLPAAILALGVPIAMIEGGLAAQRAGFDLGLVLLPLVGLGCGAICVMYLFDESDNKTIAVILYLAIIIGLSYLWVTNFHH